MQLPKRRYPRAPAPTPSSQTRRSRSSIVRLPHPTRPHPTHPIRAPLTPITVFSRLRVPTPRPGMHALIAEHGLPHPLLSKASVGPAAAAVTAAAATAAALTSTAVAAIPSALDSSDGDGGGGGACPSPVYGVFASLARSIVYQQLGTVAATTIWGRVLSTCEVGRWGATLGQARPGKARQGWIEAAPLVGGGWSWRSCGHVCPRREQTGSGTARSAGGVACRGWAGLRGQQLQVVVQELHGVGASLWGMVDVC